MMRGHAIAEGPHTADRSKTGQVYARLKSFLVNQKVPPRAKLDIGLLADHLSVSKTPVREALILLASEGIIASVPASGYFSKPLDFADLADDYDLALTVLKHVIKADITAFSAMGLPPVRQVSSGPGASPGRDLPLAYTGFIESLYERVAGMAKNRKYRQVIQAFNGRTTFVRTLDLMRPARLAAIADDMAEFVDLLARHDAQGAVANLDRQYHTKLELLADLVSEGNLFALRANDNWVQDL